MVGELVTKYSYGWKPNTKRFSRVHTFSARALPEIIDLSQNKPAVIDQNGVGRCAGCGTGGIISGRLSQLGLNPGNKFIVSPDDLYNLGREKEGTLNQDSGAEPYDILSMVREYGVIPYDLWPLTPKLDTTNPLTRESQAIKYPDFTPNALDTSSPSAALANILDAMAGGNFINFGFLWFLAWENYTGGSLPLQSITDPIAGGHDTFGFKADNSKKIIYAQNSWGDWGENGCYELPYGQIEVLVQLGMQAEYVTFNAPATPAPTPSSCKIGNGFAKAVNTGLKLIGRQGRIYYGNPGRL